LIISIAQDFLQAQQEGDEMNGQRVCGYSKYQSSAIDKRPFRLAAVASKLRRWWELARQRRQLSALGEQALKDLGLSRADVMQESERPFWDDPLSR
jgi:uncharacterized protein YjiS (DUF1127 family)